MLEVVVMMLEVVVVMTVIVVTGGFDSDDNVGGRNAIGFTAVIMVWLSV